MEHTIESFYKLACQEFGKERFSTNGIEISEENLQRFNSDYGSNLTKEDFLNYTAVWIIDNKCPNCNTELSWSFQWGLAHGNGYCSECKKVEIQFYHYIKDCRIPIRAYSLIGF